jgi:succinate dehydrogenase / fumarate reductase iron-sulfur subunit
MSTVFLKIRRQDDPEDIPYWEEFEIEGVDGMTVVTALMAIRERPVNAEGNATTPVAWESNCLEGGCGSCAMRINGRARLACHTPVVELHQPVTLEPLAKFPVVRDLKVDRSRMSEAMTRAGLFTSVEGIRAGIGSHKSCGCANAGNHLRISRHDQEKMRSYSDCIICGSCLEASPHVNARSEFMGPFVFGLALALNLHPIGRFDSDTRIGALIGRGGLADCASADGCDAACPMGIPLSEAMARLNWQATIYSIKKLFWG